jgi:hypothetical protein
MSTPVSTNYLESNKNRLHEIQCLKTKIMSLREKYQRRPSTIKEIKDLERQIVERGGVPESHFWIK